MQQINQARPESAGAAHSGSGGPLAGIRVLDFSHILAGPYCTRLLADLGAEVVKVETGSRPDMTAALRPDEAAPGRQDRQPLYLNTNRGKQAITLNLKHDAGREIAWRLACEADVVVENFSASVMTRLGLDYEHLSEANPRLVYLSLSGYGHTGPRRHWTSMNMNLQAHSGLMLVTGREGDPPVSIANSWNDYIGGIHGAFAVVEALRHRQHTGKGMALDVSQFECSVGTIGGLLMAAAMNARAVGRRGNRCTSAVPQGVYPCLGKDTWCAIVVRSDAQWQSLVTHIGDERLTDEKLATLDGRLAAADFIDSVLEEWTRKRDCADVEQLLKPLGIGVSRVNRIDDVLALPQADHVFPRVDDGSGFHRRVTNLPIRWSGLEPALGPAPRLGEHTGAVLSDWLGLSRGEIDELRRAGALD